MLNFPFFQLTPHDEDYPALLKEIHDVPARLWLSGDLQVLSSGIRVAIVGARQCTSYGKKVAFDLAKGLAEQGIVVVSGLAYGIDTAAHQGALAGRGKTVAVLGCGLDIPYPAQNQELRKQILENGILISELPPGTEAAPWTFPRRNRIISGLSQGVIVIEAGLKSGSLVTARMALEQGRDVFAVPGDIHSSLSAGTHRLIQQGAKLVASIQDVLDELPGELKLETVPKREIPKTSHEEGVVLDLLQSGPRHMDDLVESTGYTVSQVSSLLVEMEIGGRVKSLAGSRFERLEE